MPVPKRKRSRARRDKRFANKGIKVTLFGRCKQCDQVLLPHQACLGCGYYKGAKVMDTKADRSVKRVKQKQQKTEKNVKSADHQEEQGS
ncbi:MAG: 50S ribosomal protein L32 [Candidatus Babeliales bacterium]